jgi:transposase
MRYELTGHEWAAIKPMLPNRLRDVPRDERLRDSLKLTVA